MTSHHAAIYCRISQDREGAGLGVDRQREDCEKLASTLGWTVTSVFTDNDISAYSGKKRPGYQQLLAELRDGLADAVLVWHTDRLHRSPVELEEFIAVCEPRAVPTHTVQAGELDLATPSGRMIARMLGAAARYEVEHKSARTRRAQQQAAAAGKWLGGTHPFGFIVHDDLTAELHPVHAAEIRKACDVLLAGGSLGSIIRDWNQRGITTVNGNQWNYTSLRQVLRRPRNAGIITLCGAEVGTSQWPAIIGVPVYRAVRALLDNPSRVKSVSNVAKYLLVGLALCGKDGCRAPMKTVSAGSTAKGTMIRLYRCRNMHGETGHASRKISDLDEYVTHAVAGWLSKARASQGLRPGTAADSSALHVEGETLRGRRREAEGMFAAGQISGASLASITAAIEVQLDAVTAQIAGHVRDAALSGLMASSDPAGRWLSWPLEKQRAALPGIVTVVIRPGGSGGHRFREDLIDMEWMQAL